MCIWLVVEGFDLLVSRVSVQLDGFNERAVRFQVKDRHSRFPGLVLQGQEHTPSQPKTTSSWSDPHALEFPDSVLVKLYCATAYRLLSQTGDEQQTSWGHQFVRLR